MAKVVSPLDTYMHKLGKNPKNDLFKGEGGGPGRIRSCKDAKMKSLARTIQFKAWAYLPLIDWAIENESPNTIEYKSVVACGRTLVQSENKYLRTLKPCGSKLCPTCSRRRSAHVSKVITQLMGNWDPVMIVLTASNNDILWGLGVKEDAEALRLRIDLMYEVLAKVRESVRYEIGHRANGLCVMEVKKHPFKPPHPHFHMLLSLNDAELFIKHWLKIAPLMGLKVDEQGQYNSAYQKSKGAYQDKEKALKELLKYLLNPIVKSSKNNKNKGANYRMIDYGGIDSIITATKGKRRLMLWGHFYNANKRIKEIENAHIEELESVPDVFTDLPVKDRGEMIMPKQVVGFAYVDGKRVKVEQKKMPEFIREVLYVFDGALGDWSYSDDQTGSTYYLSGQKKISFPQLWTYAHGKRWYPGKNKSKALESWQPYDGIEF